MPAFVASDTRLRLHSARRRLASDSRLPTAILAALLLFGGVAIFWAGRRLGFFYDEWTFVVTRRGDGLATYLDPHNGHLSLIPVAIYKALFATFGLEHYWPYRLVLLIEHLACVLLLYVLVRRRLDGWAGLAAAVLLLFMSSSADNVFWAFQLSQVGSIAAGLGVLVLLDRPSRRTDRWVCVLLVIGVAYSSMGIPFLLAAAVQIVLEPGRRARWWVIALPVVLYLLWTIGYGDGSEASASNLRGLEQYVVDAAAAAAAGIVALGAAYGLVLLAFGALAVAVARRGAAGAPLPSPRLASVIVLALAFWGLTALTRGQLHEPGSSRYVSIGAIAVMLIAAELLPRGSAWTPWRATTVFVVVALITVTNAYAIRDYTRYLRGIWEPLRGALAGVEAAGAAAQPGAAIDAQTAPQLQAGTYLTAVKDLGSATGGVRWLTAAPEVRRERADQALVQAEGVALVPVTPAALPVAAGGCQIVRPIAGAPGVATIDVPDGAGLSVTGAPNSAAVALRRFADSFTVGVGAVPATGAAVIHTPADSDPSLDWHAQITATQRVQVCPVP